MHITGCTFSENLFHKFTTYDSFEKLKPLLSKQMLVFNYDEQTPIDILLANDPPLKRIERLLQFDLLPKTCFDRLEDEMVDFVTRKVIKNQKDSKLKDKLVFTKPENNKKYFQVFENELLSYFKQKESFSKRGYSDLFDQVFNVQEYEDKLGGRATITQKMYSKLSWKIQETSILVSKDIKKKKVQILEKSNKLIDNQSSISSFNTMTINPLSLPTQHKQRFFLLESGLNMAIDISSILDLLSDLIIMVSFVYSGDTAWLFVSLFTMLCPYYAVYTSLMNFQINRNRTRRENDKMSNRKRYFLEFLNMFFIFPTMLLYLIGYDLLYSIANTLCVPFLFFATLITKKNKIAPFEQFLDNIMVNSTGMSYMDIKGFRCQRTILQFQLESIPQLGFQSYLLIRLRQLGRDKDEDSLGVSIGAIEFSLAMAVTHVFLELINLYLESTTWNCGFRDYMIACHNAKQGWIAQSTSFITTDESNDDESKKKVAITFDDKEEEFCSLGFSVSFTFTDLSIDPLINVISNLPKIENRERRKTVQLGKCIAELSVDKFIQLLRLSYQKVNLDFKEPQDNIKKIIESDFEFKQRLHNPYSIDMESLSDKSIEKEPILIEMVQKDYHQVAQVMIDLGAKFDLRTKDGQNTLLKIAFQANYPQTVKLLMSLINKNPKYVKDSILEGEMFYDEIFLRDERKKKPLSPLIFLDPKCLIPYEMQISLIYNFPKLLKMNGKDQTIARDQYYWIYGAFFPDITFKIGDDMEPCIPIIEKWLNQMPHTYQLSTFEKKASFDSQFLSSFVGFRRELYKLQLKNFEPMTKYFRRVINIDNFEIQIDDLASVFSILNKDKKDGDFDIVNCDGVVREFGLDKMRDVYFHQSRMLYTGQEILSRTETVDVIMKKQWTEFPFKVPGDAIAIKSFNLTMDKGDLKQAMSFKFFVEYNTGHQKAELKPNLLLNANPESVSPNDDEQIRLLNVFFESTKDEQDIALIKLNQTLLMNIEGGHDLTFKFKSQNPFTENEQYRFKLNFEFYLRLEIISE